MTKAKDVELNVRMIMGEWQDGTFSLADWLRMAAADPAMYDDGEKAKRLRVGEILVASDSTGLIVRRVK